MNIFVLDLDPKKCAQDHSNTHVVKMVLETSQLLCGVHWVTDSQDTIPYKLSHKNHPCSVWARECIENYNWLSELGIELCKEYTNRYSKRHKSQDVIEWCINHPPKIQSNGTLTKFALAMPDEYKVDDVVESYRNYYREGKKDLLVWKNGHIPKWL